MKKTLCILVAIIILCSFISCKPSSKDGGSIKVTAVTVGELGGSVYADSVQASLDRLAQDYTVAPLLIDCEGNAELYEDKLMEAAKSSDFVVAVDTQLREYVISAAQQNPDTKFIYLDDSIYDNNNIISVVFAKDEGVFLAGYIASKMSRTGKIGAVAGGELSERDELLESYNNGAKYANPNITVMEVIANEPGSGGATKEKALSLYDQGCDIVLNLAGSGGQGVFDAAQETRNYAIGFGIDQRSINPDVILCSMVNQAGISIYKLISACIAEGTWNGGEVWHANVKNELVDILYGEDGTVQIVADDIKDGVNELKKLLASGEVAVRIRQ